MPAASNGPAKAAWSSRSDPRLYQLFCQIVILCYGLKFLEFSRYIEHIPVVLAACLFAQVLGVIALRKKTNPVRIGFDWRSPAISALSLALLLRTNELWITALAGALAIGSKFLIRVNGKHVFNPSLFGIIAVLAIFSGDAWVSPGQWGREGLLLFFVACAGGFVLFRALRSDITLAFLGMYGGLVLLRATWLGDPWPIVINQLSSGALLIFAFFMISDPKSTPDARIGRIVFAALTAAVAFAIQFGLYNSNGLLWSLFWCAFSVPLIDRVSKRTRLFAQNPFALTRESQTTPGERPTVAPILSGAGK